MEHISEKQYVDLRRVIIGLRLENEQLRLKLEPIRPTDGGVCQAIWKGSTCNNKPGFELFVPGLSRHPYILCELHCKSAETVFHSFGIYYKEYEHEYKGKQHSLPGVNI